MKKIAVSVCIFMLIAMMLPLTASASSWRIIENEQINMQKTAPTVDGTINANEGWSDPADLNEDTVGYFGLPNQMLTGSAKLYFAYTDDGLYFAVDYTEVGSAYCVKFYDENGNNSHTRVYQDPNAGTYTASEGGFPSVTPDGTPLKYYLIPGENTTSAPAGTNPGAAYWISYYDQFYTDNAVIYSSEEDSGSYATDARWDGDEFALAIDPLGEFASEGFLRDNPVLYSIAIFAGDNVKVARCDSANDADITDQVSAKGSLTEKKFVAEVFIPWSIIVDDANAAGSALGLSHTFTVDEMKADGAIHKANVTYFDRFYDEEAGYADTCGRFITAPTITAEGTNGFESSGTNYGCMGLKLATVAAQSNPDDSGSDSTADSQNGSDSETGNGSDSGSGAANDTTAKNGGGNVTTKAQNTNGNNKGNSGNKGSAQTFDAGIAVAIGLMATSGIGIVYSRKRRK